MEKILVNKYGDAIRFNEEANAISDTAMNIDCTLSRASKDGQVITDNEVIDIKEGEFTLILREWDGNKNCVKALVISDPVAIHDLTSWYEEKLKQYKNNETC